MHPKNLLTSFLLSFLMMATLVSVHGQNPEHPGYIIALNGDTITGVIEDLGEVRNSKACLFTPEGSSGAIEYKPGEISSFRFEGSKFYETKTLEIEGKKRSVFVECLVKGLVSLYYLRDGKLENYFIGKAGEELQVLSTEEREVEVNGVTQRVQTKTYVRWLKLAFADCFEIQASIDEVKLTRKSLTAITCKYNACAGEDSGCMTFDQASRVRFRVGPVIGYSFNRLALNGDRLFESFDFSSSNHPVFGLSVLLSSERLNRLSIQLGTDMGKSDFQASHEEQSWSSAAVHYYYDAYLQSLSMKIYGGLKYTFSRGRIRPNLGGGLMFHKHLQTDFWYVQEIHILDNVRSEEWRGNPVKNMFYGAYLELGLDMDLSDKMLLFVNLKGGYCTSNPNTFAGLDQGIAKQIRISPEQIPLTFSLGICF